MPLSCSKSVRTLIAGSTIAVAIGLSILSAVAADRSYIQLIAQGGAAQPEVAPPGGAPGGARGGSMSERIGRYMDNGEGEDEQGAGGIRRRMRERFNQMPEEKKRQIMQKMRERRGAGGGPGFMEQGGFGGPGQGEGGFPGRGPRGGRGGAGGGFGGPPGGGPPGEAPPAGQGPPGGPFTGLPEAPFGAPEEGEGSMGRPMMGDRGGMGGRSGMRGRGGMDGGIGAGRGVRNFRRGMRGGGEGLLGGRGPLDLSSLNLSDEQKTKIQAMRSDNSVKSRQLQGLLRDKRKEMQSILFDPNANQKQIMKKRDELRALRNQQEDLMLNDFIGIRSVLNKEQLQQLPGVGFGGGRRALGSAPPKPPGE